MATIPHTHLPSVDSTLSEAWRMVEGGDAPPFWLTADEQTQGRGRMERSWVSEPGNLYSTLVLASPADAHLPLIPFAVTLAVGEAIRRSLPEHKRSLVTHKWPNDVLIEGAKTSGILIERRVITGASLLAIGMGVNVAHAPAIAGRETTCLADEGSDATPPDVFAELQGAMLDVLSTLQRAPQTIVPTWLKRAQGLGEPVSVITGNTTLKGTFDHLAADGALMLRLPSGALQAVHTGDVVIKPR